MSQEKRFQKILVPDRIDYLRILYLLTNASRRFRLGGLPDLSIEQWIFLWGENGPEKQVRPVSGIYRIPGSI